MVVFSSKKLLMEINELQNKRWFFCEHNLILCSASDIEVFWWAKRRHSIQNNEYNSKTFL